MKLLILTLLCCCAAAETKAEKDLREQLAVAQREKAALIAALARATVGGAATSTKVESGSKAAATGRKEANQTAISIAESAKLTADSNAKIERQTAERASGDRERQRVHTEQLQRTGDASTNALKWGFYTLAFGTISQFLFSVYNRRSERLATERKEERAEILRKELAQELRNEVSRATAASDQAATGLTTLQAGQERIHKIVNSVLTSAKQIALSASRRTLHLLKKDPRSNSAEIETTEKEIVELQQWIDHQQNETEEAEKQLKVDLAKQPA